MLTKEPGIDNRCYYDRLFQMFEYLEWGYMNDRMPKTDVYDDLERALADYGLTEDDVKTGYRDDIDWEKVALRMYISVSGTEYNLYHYADDYTISFERGSLFHIKTALERVLPFDVWRLVGGGVDVEKYDRLIAKYC